MKKLILILVLTLSLQSWTKADDIRDFEIEGMSIGDSLLNFFNKNEIEKNFPLPNKKFASHAGFGNNFETYQGFQAFYYVDDDNYIIHYLAGKNYSIADIATWPWIARHEWHDIGLKNYKNLTRWYLEIADREAVIKGYNFMEKGESIPKP